MAVYLGTLSAVRALANDNDAIGDPQDLFRLKSGKTTMTDFISTDIRGEIEGQQILRPFIAVYQPSQLRKLLLANAKGARISLPTLPEITRERQERYLTNLLARCGRGASIIAMFLVFIAAIPFFIWAIGSGILTMATAVSVVAAAALAGSSLARLVARAMTRRELHTAVRQLEPML